MGAMNAPARLTNPSAARQGRRPSPVRTALVATAVCALATLGGCANMEFQFANTMSPAKASQRYFNPYDPGSSVNVWNAF
jgi:hypothetical protein